MTIDTSPAAVLDRAAYEDALGNSRTAGMLRSLVAERDGARIALKGTPVQGRVEGLDLICRIVMPMVSERSREKGDAWDQAHDALAALDHPKAQGEVARHSETIRAIEIMLSRLKWNTDHERALRMHLENERRFRLEAMTAHPESL